MPGPPLSTANATNMESQHTTTGSSQIDITMDSIEVSLIETIVLQHPNVVVVADNNSNNTMSLDDDRSKLDPIPHTATAAACDMIERVQYEPFFFPLCCDFFQNLLEVRRDDSYNNTTKKRVNIQANIGELPSLVDISHDSSGTQSILSDIYGKQPLTENTTETFDISNPDAIVTELEEGEEEEKQQQQQQPYIESDLLTTFLSRTKVKVNSESELGLPEISNDTNPSALSKLQSSEEPKSVDDTSDKNDTVQPMDMAAVPCNVSNIGTITVSWNASDRNQIESTAVPQRTCSSNCCSISKSLLVWTFLMCAIHLLVRLHIAQASTKIKPLVDLHTPYWLLIEHDFIIT